MIFDITSFFPFFLLAGAFAGMWVLRQGKERVLLFAFFVFVACLMGRIHWIALLSIVIWSALWLYYAKNKDRHTEILCYSALVFFSFAFKFHQLPGFENWNVSGKFWLGLDAPIIGFFPLALLLPLAKTRQEWGQTFSKVLWLTVLGIGAMTLLAISSGTVALQAKWPTYALVRYFANLFLTAIPEEGFYRGFVQGQLAKFLGGTMAGKWAALIISSLLFTLAHIGWSPSLAIFGFVFLAGLLYGGVFWLSGRIESAILCHFLLNFIHMTFFSYHAM